jgi:hypothetical protein
MKSGIAVGGFGVAALLFLFAAIVHVVRLNAVDAPLVLCAITSFSIALVVHAASLEDDAPPVL